MMQPSRQNSSEGRRAGCLRAFQYCLTNENIYLKENLRPDILLAVYVMDPPIACSCHGYYESTRRFAVEFSVALAISIIKV